MSITSSTGPSFALRKAVSPVQRVLILCIFLTNFPFPSTANLDSTGKQITFYPSSLMISHVHPLIFYSDTKLLHLVTHLKAIPPGPSLQMINNCSIPHTTFFGRLFNTIDNTQRIMNRSLSLSSFSNLLECDSYLWRYYTYATGLVSRMTCPRHYQPILAACKAWALQNCHGFTTHEKISQTTRRPVVVVSCVMPAY